jgi:hypothetical protein
MNKFQLDILKKLIELISPTEVGDICISISKGPSEVVVEVKLISKNFSFWIYEDGASILGKNIDVRYEAESYREASVLASVFFEKAKSITEF